MAEGILDRVYGSLIGGAIGDAMGAPVEGWYWTDIRERYGRVEEFMPFETGYSLGTPGSATDDTVLRHYVCLAIAEKRGRISPDDLAIIWTERLNPARLWENERLVLIKLRQGMNPWESGRGAIPAGCASMAIAPVGIINAGDPRQAYQDGFNIASVNADGVNRDAAASLAAGCAAAFLPGATHETVTGAMIDHSSDLLRRAYVLTMELARDSGSVDGFAERFYDRMLDWTWPQKEWRPDRYFSGNSHEFVPVVMALLYLCEGDVNECIIEGASFGRDCDTIASIAGSLAGALQGAGSIRAAWIEQCESANEEFFEETEGDPGANFHAMAVRLVEALECERRRARGRAEFLSRLLGENT